MQLFWLIPLIAVAIFWVQYIRHSARRRCERLGKLAEELGFRFDPSPPPIHDGYEGLEPFGKGESCRSSNLLFGRVDEIDFEIFDYHFYVKNGNQGKVFDYGIVAAWISTELPRLELRPEGLVDRFFGMLGFVTSISSQSSSTACTM